MQPDEHTSFAIRARRGSLCGVVVVALLIVASCSSDAAESQVTEPGGATAAEDAPTTTAPVVRASEGCGTPPDVEPTDEAPGDVEMTFSFGGQDRVYRIAVPDSYDPDTPNPLVMNLHGYSNTALTQSHYTAMPAAASERGVLVVAPDAGDTVWDYTPEGPDDVYLIALLDDLEGRYCINLDRVHLAGMSLGAWRSALTGCRHPDRFASIALVTVEVHPGCAMPVIAFHGTADETAPYGEGADPGVQVTGQLAALPGARDNAASWAEAAGCEPEPLVERPADSTELRTYEDCENRIDVQLYTMVGAGHVWPGSPIELPGAFDHIDATELILDFFEDHPLIR